jgi:hypothetical protein
MQLLRCFVFMGEMRGRFWVRTQLPDSDETAWIDRNRLRKKKLQHLIEGYKIPVIEVDGDIGDIIDVFVRINSSCMLISLHPRKSV